MSQAGVVSTIFGPVPPAVATSYVTNDGTAIPALNILNVTAVDSSENSVAGTVTRATPNLGPNLLIVTTNRLRGTGNSVAASPLDLITFTLDAAATKSYRFDFHVTGRSTAGSFIGESVGYTVFVSAKTIAATASIVATPFIDADEDANLTTATINVINIGNTVILRATGVATETITYNAVGSYVVV